MVTLIILILSIAFFLSIMAVAIALPLRPSIVRITARFVCPTSTTMKVQTTSLNTHRPSTQRLVVTCQGGGKTLYVNAKAFLWLWMMFFVAAAPIATGLGLLINRGLP